jgi:UDP-N-acetylglucosamine 2-epimerase (non-hydrolysing)
VVGGQKSEIGSQKFRGNQRILAFQPPSNAITQVTQRHGESIMKLCIVAGARPNFMKIAPIIEAIISNNGSSEKKIEYLLVHTGQHYDEKMSKLFFEELGIPTPDVDLEVGSASHAVQTAEIMKRFEKVCLEEKPSHVLVVGDVNSTIACALVATKLGIKVIHVEAGLRSFDRDMPEEINRILTDCISDILFITEESAVKNLANEGVSKDKIYFVGNVMIDTLLKHRAKAEQSQILEKLSLTYPINSSNPINPSNAVVPYSVLTLHRPSNVDDKETFQNIIEALSVAGKDMPIIFPIHPRTANKVREFGLDQYFNWELYDSPLNSSNPSHSSNTSNPINSSNTINPRIGAIVPIPPLGYLDFMRLMSKSRLVLTDSGGIQEETTILGVPCVTMRENTERPVTISHGTNVLAGVKKENIIKAAQEQLDKFKDNGGTSGTIPTPPKWDGRAAERIVEILVRIAKA